MVFDGVDEKMVLPLLDNILDVSLWVMVDAEQTSASPMLLDGRGSNSQEGAVESFFGVR